jgi:NAD+ synthetase
MRLHRIPIHGIVDAVGESLAPLTAGAPPGLTEENIQARIRGILLMAHSNRSGALLLSTGNKSELSMGYCTLYGDMNGGLAVLGDLLKTTVYELARHLNKDGEMIPWASIEKPPSAELRPGQLDSDSLPPYPVLDRILHQILEENAGPKRLIASGEDPALVYRILQTIDRNEYKRWQAPPVLRVTSKAFGSGRRIPLAARFQPGT